MTNQIIQNDDFIVTLYVIIDDFYKNLNKNMLLDNKKKPVRTPVFDDVEMIVLIFLRWKTTCISWKSFYTEIFPYYHKYFKKQITYKNFIKSIHRTMPIILHLIPMLNFVAYGKSKKKFYIDSCPITVCHIKRASSHKVCEKIASRKKSTMGWFYGFKLHAVCNENRQIVALEVTTASVDDRNPVLNLLKNLNGTVWADAGHISEKLRKTLAKNGIKFIAAPRKNMKKLMTKMQRLDIKKRQSIEQVFSVIKTRFGLNCSLARSIDGVISILMSAIMWYQAKTLFFNS